MSKVTAPTKSDLSGVVAELTKIANALEAPDGFLSYRVGDGEISPALRQLIGEALRPKHKRPDSSDGLNDLYTGAVRGDGTRELRHALKSASELLGHLMQHKPVTDHAQRLRDMIETLAGKRRSASDSGPPKEWSEAMTKPEMARRRSRNADARPRSCAAFFKEHDLIKVEGQNYMICLDKLNTEERRRLATPL